MITNIYTNTYTYTECKLVYMCINTCINIYTLNYKYTDTIYSTLGQHYCTHYLSDVNT